MKKLYTILAVIMVVAFMLSACGGSSAPAKDLLSEVKARGTLIISTDPAYPPQSEIKANPQRTPGTKCTSDQKTIGELEGFDIDVAAAIAKGLGVEPCWVTPDWTLITAGNWAGRWDISVGSMTITPERAKALYFAQPYYTTPAAMFVYKTNTSYTSPADLSGKKIGVWVAVPMKVSWMDRWFCLARISISRSRTRRSRPMIRIALPLQILSWATASASTLSLRLNPPAKPKSRTASLSSSLAILCTMNILLRQLTAVHLWILNRSSLKSRRSFKVCIKTALSRSFAFSGKEVT